MARNEHVRRAARDRLDVLTRDPHARVGPVEDEPDLLRLDPHELERLQPELRVLQRKRVEHPHDTEVVAASMAAITSGVKPGRRVDDHEVGAGAQYVEQLA